jgi:hypothetical protein
MKPNVMGSGTGINSALGDPTTNGDRYHHINGTSMATPTIAGVAALVRSANPTLTSDQVRQILMDTADHRKDRGQQPPSAADPFGVDPNYHPSWGWGQVDAYAAVEEAQNAATTQVVRIQALPQRGPDGVRINWVTQREVGLRIWQLDRAPDVAGAPGAWSPDRRAGAFNQALQIHRFRIGMLTATPISTVRSIPRRTTGTACAGSTGSVSHSEPAIACASWTSPVLARVKYSWTHNYSTVISTLASAPAPTRRRRCGSARGSAPSRDSVVDVGGVTFTGRCSTTSTST